MIVWSGKEDKEVWKAEFSNDDGKKIERTSTRYVNIVDNETMNSYVYSFVYYTYQTQKLLTSVSKDPSQRGKENSSCTKANEVIKKSIKMKTNGPFLHSLYHS